MKNETQHQIPFLTTREEFQDFIIKSLEKRDKKNKRVIIGKVCEEAKQHIKNVCGKEISDIDIDSNGIIHALIKTEHNIESDDLLYAVDVINTTKNITLSKKRHQDCDVLVFKKDIDGDITFLTEAHIGNDFLLVFNAYRQKKARRRPDAT